MFLDGHTPLCLKYQPPNEAFDFDDSFLVPLLYEDRSSLSLFANIQMDETEENLSVNQGMVRRLFVLLKQPQKMYYECTWSVILTFDGQWVRLMDHVTAKNCNERT